MSPRDSVLAYRQSSAFGASPVGQVIALYDAVVRDVHQAMAAANVGEIEKRVGAVNHALTVIGELQSVLDFDRGGEAARNLDVFYNVARGLIMQASLTDSHERFHEVLAMFIRLRAAWSKIEPSIAPAESSPHPRLAKNSAAEPSSARYAPEAPDSADHRDSEWSA